MRRMEQKEKYSEKSHKSGKLGFLFSSYILSIQYVNPLIALQTVFL